MFHVSDVKGSLVRFLFSYHVLMGRKSESLVNEMCMREMLQRSVEKMGRDVTVLVPG